MQEKLGSDYGCVQETLYSSVCQGEVGLGDALRESLGLDTREARLMRRVSDTILKCGYAGIMSTCGVISPASPLVLALGVVLIPLWVKVGEGNPNPNPSVGW